MKRLEPDNTKSNFIIIILGFFFLSFLIGRISRSQPIDYLHVLIIIFVIVFVGGLYKVQYELVTENLLIKRLYGIWVQKRELSSLRELQQKRENVNFYHERMHILSGRKVFKTSYRVLLLKFGKPWESIRITEQSMTSTSFDRLNDTLKKVQKIKRRK